ncbi:MAG: 50S ribosomal protein L9 [Alphaproteobacteria bacterium]|nr:50S ribosomal protein L9 [Rhodospirillales bacterium]MCW9045818.1 50S ribosomal protein L9 [Alphaproteobacteria bacterium]
MEVILLERIEKLGQMGDVVAVKAGYARNYLLPQKKAMRSTKANLAFFEGQKAQLEAESLKRKEEAEAVAAKMDSVMVDMIRQAGESGQLYGSVNSRDIADGVTEAGFTISRSQVILASPIKSLGLFKVTVALHPEVNVEVTANVARSADEAKIQAETGEALISVEEEEDNEPKLQTYSPDQDLEAEAAEEEAAVEAEVVKEETEEEVSE